MARRVAVLLLAAVLLQECAGVRKFYSRPMKFRMNRAQDQETSATKHEGAQLGFCLLYYP